MLTFVINSYVCKQIIAGRGTASFIERREYTIVLRFFPDKYSSVFPKYENELFTKLDLFYVLKML